MPQDNLPPATDRYCQHCGGKLDIQLGPSDGRQQSAETTCTICGRKDGYSQSNYWTRQRDPSLFQRLRNFRRRGRRADLPSFLSADGAPDIRIILEELNFPVYALIGKPIGLRLKSIGMGRQQSNTETTMSASLTYQLGHPLNPDAAIDFEETTRDRYRQVEEPHLEAARTEFDFNAVTIMVRNNSSEEQGKHWFTEGDFYGLWNRNKAAEATRETVEIEIAGATRKVIVASWHEPFNVNVFRFTLPPVHLTVCSLNLSRQDVFESFNHLSVLKGDDVLLADHQADIAETRKLLWPDR